ncbi:amino acid/amide ABC transporter membrane protein 2, HAAT family [Tistlia consotensis]|uniref:Amino acid/amide ABC transporter membrane protein 2, HAAT family n=1 Tax=Tistlia consotensis USBA 355 TaxID=560819 RepID=A0A1Y6B464_9PROT|nr:branched-chain amino acid ABC transporter permease [Tistlia consotensis]SME91000.1 amino acid/amide ABC transporter membrane protein 2, HAAT family [Tistlia consotensis USBA 355]SNR27047.1 amino acid/amide ABC transporter membrane protein 2, HAAT family [Tistlia consotensis]
MSAARIDWRIVAAGCLAVLAAIALGGRGGAPLVTEMLLMALFASSLNLLMSYGGMVSFGHAAFFGLGAYGLALAVSRFGLPVAAGLACGPLLAGLLALVFGTLCVRLSHIYFAMLTLACGQITFTVLFQWYDFTGGDTGITGFMAPAFGLDERWFAVVVLGVVVACLLALWRVVNAPLGITIRSVGEDPERVSASGLNPRRVQLTAFVIAGTLAGVAGSLFAALQGNAFPDYAGLGFTLDSLIMVVLGGLRSFGGGLYGAVIYVLLRNYVPLLVTEWELVIGVILLLVVLWSPEGFAGGLQRIGRRLRSEPRP